MEPVERNKAILRKYIPEGSVDTIAGWIYRYDFKLRVKRPRSSKEGDYMPPHNGKNHTISVNRDLNPYAFLITLVHEVAHLVTWKKYGGRVNPHGEEWKKEYGALLDQFLARDSASEEKLFPSEISSALHRHKIRPSAASCSDLHLARILKKFDADTGSVLLEKIAEGTSFRLVHERNRFGDDIFVKGPKRRTRYACIHVRTKRTCLVHALCKVYPA